MSGYRLTHIRALDGLRGFAIALVLALHSGYAKHLLGCGLGVDVFFVLSGFLITSLLLDEHDATGRIALGNFYLRRILRLYPALVLMVIAAAIVHTELPGRTWDAFGTAAAAALFYVANLVTAFSHNGSAIDGLGHTWTLAMEEQFYIVWPVLLTVALRTRRSWIPFAILAAGVLVSLASLHHSGPDIRGIPQAYFRPDSRDIGLLLGCGTALALRHQRWRSVARAAAWPWIGSSLLVVAIVSAGHAGIGYLTDSVPIASVAAAVLIAGIAIRREHVVARLLSWPPLCWLGIISYGVYVYSGLFDAATASSMATWSPLAQTLVRTGVALILATASFLLVEQPIRRRGRQWLVARSRPDATRASG